MTPRSFEELLRGRHSDTPPHSAPSQKPAAAAPSPHGDLGAVIPARAGFAAPELPEPAAPSRPMFPDLRVPPPRQAEKLVEKVLDKPDVRPAAGPSPAPPFGQRVVAASGDAQVAQQTGAGWLGAKHTGSSPKSDATSAFATAADAKSGFMSGPAAVSGATADIDPTAGYEVIAAMPAARAKPSPAAPGAATASTVSQPSGPSPSKAADIAPALSGAASAPVAPDATPASAEMATMADKPMLRASEAGFEEAAIESTAAAASALGALAAGLAASAKSFAPPIASSPAVAAPQVAAPAIPDRSPVRASEPSGVPPSVTAPEPGLCSIPQVSILPAAQTAATAPAGTTPGPEARIPPAEDARGPGPAMPAIATRAMAMGGVETRTLEDTVAELLRPMLRQWLDENMPRIVEKALRIEVADSVRSALPAAPKPRAAE